MVTLRLALIALVGWVGFALADEADPGRKTVELQSAAVAALPAAPAETIRKDKVAAVPAPTPEPSAYVDDQFEQYDGSTLLQWWLRYGQTLGRAQ
jgi:hypothetical protein